MNIFKNKYILLFGLLSTFLSASLYAQDVLKKKYSDKAVQDYVGLLSPSETNALNQKLTAYADSTSTGIAIAITNSVEDDINYYAAQVLTSWGLGQKGKDNGVLMLMDIKQRKIAISTGYGVEHLLTDALSKRIIENNILPEFKKGNYYGGLDQGSTAIIQVLEGAYTNTNPKNDIDISSILPIIIFIIIILLLANKKQGGSGNRGHRSSGMDFSDIIILSNMGRGGFGRSSGGGFGGGGFGGFGGGMGGGGGASGGW